MKKTKITKESILAEILKNNSKKEILAKHGVPCVTCPYAKMEMEKLKIGEVCEMYGINLDKLLKDLNEKAKKQGSCPVRNHARALRAR